MGVTSGPNHPSSDIFHDLLILMSVRYAGEMPLPSEVFNNKHLCGICHLYTNASLLAVNMLNQYECSLEFASENDVAQIAQDLGKVACWH